MKILKYILKKIGIEKSIPKLYTIQVGELSDEQMKKFNLGRYSNK